MVNDVIEGFLFEPPIPSDVPEREGTVCQIVDRGRSENTLETGPAFVVKFGDGHQMEAYSAELRPYYATQVARRLTRVMLEITWDDERDDHPAGWEFKALLEGNPFVGPSSDRVEMITFIDVDEEGNPEQV